ncbi:MAG: hypothetical protein JJ902_23240 [Roseibium sp.]|nr:hypothetical protein [Roseibium sp.]
MQKTFKRETALVLALFLAGLCLYDIAAGGGTGAFQWAELFSVPIFSLVALAFGADSYAKQWRPNGAAPAEPDPEINGPER